MPIDVEHPVLLVVIAAACSPILLFSARWYWDDLEAFLEELGYRSEDDIWWKLIRTSMPSAFIWIKIVGFIGGYAIVVGGFYLSLSRLAH